MDSPYAPSGNRKGLNRPCDQTAVQFRTSASTTRRFRLNGQFAPAYAKPGHVPELDRAPVEQDSESRQALRAVVGNLHAGDLVERPVWLRSVTHQFRGIAVDLVKIRAIRRSPVVARAAGDVSTEPPGGTVSRNPRARRIAHDFQAAA